MRRILKLVASFAALMFLVIQFWRPDRTNPPVIQSHRLEAQMSVPQNVDAVFSRACADCHSNETHWPWYTNVSPISWFIADHVRIGRNRMNFSDWDGVKAQPDWVKERLQGICKEIQSGGMPLSSYRLIHWKAKLSSGEIRVVCKWTELQRQQMQTVSDSTGGTLPK